MVITFLSPDASGLSTSSMRSEIVFMTLSISPLLISASPYTSGSVAISRQWCKIKDRKILLVAYDIVNVRTPRVSSPVGAEHFARKARICFQNGLVQHLLNVLDFTVG